VIELLREAVTVIWRNPLGRALIYAVPACWALAGLVFLVAHL
jgi:hypothetical protein